MEDKGKDNGKDGTSKKKLANRKITKVIHLGKVNMEFTFPQEQLEAMSYIPPPSPKKAMKAMKAMQKKKAMKAMKAMKATKAMKKG